MSVETAKGQDPINEVDTLRERLRMAEAQKASLQETTARQGAGIRRYRDEIVPLRQGNQRLVGEVLALREALTKAVHQATEAEQKAKQAIRAKESAINRAQEADAKKRQAEEKARELAQQLGDQQREAQLIEGLRGENQRLAAENLRLGTSVDELVKANAGLTAELEEKVGLQRDNARLREVLHNVTEEHRDFRTRAGNIGIATGILPFRAQVLQFLGHMPFMGPRWQAAARETIEEVVKANKQVGQNPRGRRS